MRKYGRTETAKLIVAFRNFAKAPVNWNIPHYLMHVPCICMLFLLQPTDHNIFSLYNDHSYMFRQLYVILREF
jgi:hypothetical protein